MSGQGWRVLGVSVPGERHIGSGGGCEDAHRHSIRPDGTVILAVADGVSRSAWAAEAAAVGCGAAVRAAEGLLDRNRPDAGARWRELVMDALGAARGRVLAAASALLNGSEFDAGAFRATLTLAVAAPPWLALASVGDGFVVGARRAGDVHLLLPSPLATEGPVNVTTALASPAALHTARIRCVWDPELAGIGLSTDGLVAAAIDRPGRRTATVHRGLMDRLLAHLGADGDRNEVAELLLAHPGIRESTDDDRTVLMAVRE